MFFDFSTIDILLICASFFTSLTTAVMGVGGGMMLMILMLMVHPPLTAIPVHAVVQLGSNTSRAYFLRHYINWHFLIPFAIGAFIGGICGTQIVFNLPQDILRVTVGVLALIFIWLPKFKSDLKIPFKIPLLGWVASFFGMFGAGGGTIFGVAMARMNLPKQDTVATFAICMTTLHLTKIILFGFFGFVFVDYIPLMAGMMITGFFGSWVGTHILHKIDNQIFVYLLKGMISLLCLKLILFG